MTPSHPFVMFPSLSSKFVTATFILTILHQSRNVYSSSQGHCIWYGRCAKHPYNPDQMYNCHYNGPPKPLEDERGLHLLKDLCPEFIDSSGKALTCCDTSQLEDLENGPFKTVAYQFLHKCPACWNNFRKYYCMMTCSPTQSHFFYPTELKREAGVHQQHITKLDYFVNKPYANRFYSSCKDVNAAMGMNVMLVFCGQGPETCTPTDFLQAMGENPAAPFPINVTVTDDNYVEEHGQVFLPLDVPTIPCNKPVEMGGPACICSDCNASCGSTTQQDVFSFPSADEGVVNMWGVDGSGMLIVAIVLYIVLATLFLAFVIYAQYRKRFQGAQPRRERISSRRANEASKESLPLQDSSTGSTDDTKVEQPISPTHRDFLSRHAAGSDNTELIQDKSSNLIQEQNNDIEDDATAVAYFTTFASQVEDKIEEFFVRWGRFCAKNPFAILIVGFSASASMSLGLLFFSVVTDPIALWAMPDSRARLERDYFDSHFEPFYRTEQVIIVPRFVNVNATRMYENETYGPAFDQQFLLEAMKLQLQIEDISVTVDNRKVTLEDICFAPLAPLNNKCTIFSVFNYFQNNLTRFEALTHQQQIEKIRRCTKNPTSINCLGLFGGPIFPYIIVGGFQNNSYINAEVLTLTFVVRNYYNKTKIANALAWEREFVTLLSNFKSQLMDVYFFAERSVEDELDSETHADITTVFISYVIMFCYISIGLGQANSFRRLLVDSKITLGFFGTVIVTMSVTSSIGIFGFLGIPATLIVLEVVPFMVLAVGVDNIFILVQAYQRDIRKPNENREEQIGRVFGDVAPSMLLSSITDALGFYLGAMSSMPAVKTFGLYAGTACLIAFLLQITCFVSLLGLDAKRQELNRLDVCCCVYGRKMEHISPRTGLMYRLMKNFYAPFLMKTPVRIVVVLTFLGWLCSSVAVINKVDVGLEQELSMSKDSYVYRYFQAFKAYMAIGPPVYFVVKRGVDYSALENQNMMCSGPGCANNSLLAHISFASHHPAKSRISQEAMSWIDDYTSWLTAGSCCRHKPGSMEFCPSTDMSCDRCAFKPFTTGGIERVVGADFVKYLPYFLRDNPSPSGCIGGHAAYSSAVEFVDKSTVGATYFMTYHTVLKTSKDYYEALMMSRYIADKITNALNKNMAPSSDGQQYEVFPYSVFYVFYEQYLTMWRDTMLNLLYSSLTIFLMAFLILGFNPHLSAIIVFTVIMIVTNLIGAMYWWNVQLNAVSLVNLVVAVGIAVEFCSHISRAFAISIEGSKILRTQESLVNMGSSVLSGITLTKFSGILVLAFAKSQIFQIYYFRINLCIVLFGAAHGLIFLPVLLSFFGPPVSKKKLLISQQNQRISPYQEEPHS